MYWRRNNTGTAQAYSVKSDIYSSLSFICPSLISAQCQSVVSCMLSDSFWYKSPFEVLDLCVYNEQTERCIGKETTLEDAGSFSYGDNSGAHKGFLFQHFHVLIIGIISICRPLHCILPIGQLDRDFIICVTIHLAKGTKFK